MAFKTYDPKYVIITFGPVIVDGVDEDSFLTVEREEDTFTKKVGASGEVVRSRSRNRSGTTSLRLLASSATNDRLSAIAALDEAFGTGVHPLRVTDLSGTTLVSVENAWIQRLPQVEFAKTAGAREWVFGCAEIDMLVGGVSAF